MKPDDLRVGARVRLLATGKHATVTDIVGPGCANVRLDGGGETWQHSFQLELSAGDNLRAGDCVMHRGTWETGTVVRASSFAPGSEVQVRWETGRREYEMVHPGALACVPEYDLVNAVVRS